MVHLTMAQATYALNNGLGPNTIVELEQLPYWMEFSVCQRQTHGELHTSIMQIEGWKRFLISLIIFLFD